MPVLVHTMQTLAKSGSSSKPQHGFVWAEGTRTPDLASMAGGSKAMFESYVVAQVTGQKEKLLTSALSKCVCSMWDCGAGCLRA